MIEVIRIQSGGNQSGLEMSIAFTYGEGTFHLKLKNREKNGRFRVPNRSDSYGNPCTHQSYGPG